MDDELRKRGTSEAPLLAVDGLQAWYGESHVLHGVTFEVRSGEVVTLLGRNGAGKTTTMRAVMGMLVKRKGSVRYGGRELIRAEFEERTWEAFRGVVLEGRPPDEIAANLGITAAAVRKSKSRVLHRLKEQLGDLIS